MLHTDDDGAEDVLLAKPIGQDGPVVVTPVSREWMIGGFGKIGGEYNVVSTGRPGVEVGRGNFNPPPNARHGSDPFEIATMKTAVASFIEAAADLGVAISRRDASIVGPALWLTPIVIFRKEGVGFPNKRGDASNVDAEQCQAKPYGGPELQFRHKWTHETSN